MPWINRDDLPRRTGYCWQAGGVGDRAGAMRAKPGLAEWPMGPRKWRLHQWFEFPGAGGDGLVTSDHSQFLSIRAEGDALHVAVLGAWTLDVAVTLNDTLQGLAARGGWWCLMPRR
ncbi:MAG: hypothetical protein O2985_04545 [Proteobacteria bacterium]|nr:hypothetical protein [Pseudomonadota bacterium]